MSRVIELLSHKLTDARDDYMAEDRDLQKEIRMYLWMEALHSAVQQMLADEVCE